MCYRSTIAVALRIFRGINPRAIVALVIGVVVALIGLAVPPLSFLYDYAWFVGFFLSAAIYYFLMRTYKR